MKIKKKGNFIYYSHHSHRSKFRKNIYLDIFHDLKQAIPDYLNSKTRQGRNTRYIIFSISLLTTILKILVKILLN